MDLCVNFRAVSEYSLLLIGIIAVIIGIFIVICGIICVQTLVTMLRQPDKNE